jgi:hypothetical protein
MRKMAELIQQRRPPMEIMQWYASEIELKERANEDVVQQPV